MRFNAKELSAVAVQPSYKFDKEGILLVKEKKEGIFRRSDVLFQRWCRLRGNLLFYFKTKDQYSEPAGVFVLEQCSVVPDLESELPFAFNLVYAADNEQKQLAATSEYERECWIKALHTASLDNMRSKLIELTERLKQQKINCDSPSSQSLVSTRHRSFSCNSSNSYDPQNMEPSIELNICCDNLKCDGDGHPPNPLVCISVNTNTNTAWIKFSQTEVIEKSSNPHFFTTVTFLKSEAVEIIGVKLSVYDVRERITSTSTVLGESVFFLDELTRSIHNTLRLTLTSLAGESVGFITVSARELKNSQPRSAWLLLAEEDSLWSKVERPRSYSLPTKLSSQVGIPILGQLRTLYSNFALQTYCFHTGLGAELHVHEIMSESKLAFSIPCMLLNLWITEEKELMDKILHLGELSSEWRQKQLAAAECHLHIINQYTEILDFLTIHKTLSFKPSAMKKVGIYEFVPVNLHLQRMWVQNVTTRKSGAYDIVTVGAFSAFSQHFYQGGLFRLLSHLKNYSAYVSTDNSSAIFGPDPISRAAEAIMRIEQLQEEIERDLKVLIVHMDQNSGSVAQAVLNSLSSKGNQLTHICIPQMVNDMLMLWETIKSFNSHVVSSSSLSTEISKTLCNSVRDHDTSNSATDDISEGNKQELPNSISCTKIENSQESCDASKISSEKVVENISVIPCDIPVVNNEHLDSSNESHSSKIVCNPQFSGKAENSLKSQSSPDELEPLDLTHLNIKASIMCMASKIQSFIQARNSVGTNETPNWTEELMPSIKKLRQAILCLQRTAGLTYAIISMKESAALLSLNQDVRHRRDVVFSQALTSVVTGLMTRLWCHNADAMFVHMLRTVGVLAHFEGLLSCYGKEMGALEDMVVGADDLRRVLFSLEPCDPNDNPQPRIEGSRLFLSVVIPAPPSVIALLPKECSKGCNFTLCSVFFNIGINEHATVAEKFGYTSLQEKINQDSLNLLKEHFSRFQRAAKEVKNQGFRFAESYITGLIDRLQTLIYSKKSKNVEILHVAAEVCRHLGGIRFTSCKSAKDRTAMAVTLEQTMVLLKDFNLNENEMIQVLECMRSEGTRRENTVKNIGVRKYSFTSLQLMTLPKLYRPPAGTYGNVST